MAGRGLYAVGVDAASATVRWEGRESIFDEDEDGLGGVDIDARGDGEIVAEELGVLAADGGDFADDHVADGGGPVAVIEFHEVAGPGIVEGLSHVDRIAAEGAIAHAFGEARG